MFPCDTALGAFSIVVAVCVLIWALRGRPAWPRLVLVVAALVYAELVVVAAFFPLPMQAMLLRDLRLELRQSPWVSLVPLADITDLLGGTPQTALRQLAGNVLLFVPLGCMVPLLLGGRRRLVGVVLIALAVSVAIELAQLTVSVALGFPYRHASVDDVLLNIVGAGIGYVGYVLTRPLVQPVLHASSTNEHGAG